MQPTLNEVEIWAHEAGAILRNLYGKPHEVNHKGVIDLVTEADARSEQFLLSRVRSKYPDHEIITEESGKHDGDKNHSWLIDPLDGTVNFAHHIPIFAVSIAYLEEGQTRLAVVYDPMRDECFSAERNKGAWLNGLPIQVSNSNELIRSLLVTGFPYDIQTVPDNNLDHYAYFAKCSQGVRRLGSAALDCCYVAAGRFDGYWELRIKPWDIGAGSLIIEEAGGLVTNFEGSRDYLKPPYSLVAANPILHAKILAGLRK